VIPGGGLCEFGIELRNRGPERFRGEAWSTIDYFPNQAPFRPSRFRIGKVGTMNPMPDQLNLGTGQSNMLSFQLDIPEDLPDLSTICASATVGVDPHPQFHNFGDRFLFCVVTQSGNVGMLSEKEGRKRINVLRGQRLH
jgi:hypothetical protein